MTDEENAARIAAASARYHAAAHGMQTGVALRPGADDQKPKHLRVGINVAMSDLGALCALLIEKGVITEVELHEKLAAHMETERDSQQALAQETLGLPVKLV